jgi:hypothetical protein
MRWLLVCRLTSVRLVFLGLRDATRGRAEARPYKSAPASPPLNLEPAWSCGRAWVAAEAFQFGFEFADALLKFWQAI